MLKLYNSQRFQLPHWSWLVMLASDNQLYPLASLGYHPLTCRNCLTVNDFSSPMELAGPDMATQAKGSPPSVLKLYNCQRFQLSHRSWLVML